MCIGPKFCNASLSVLELLPSLLVITMANHNRTLYQNQVFNLMEWPSHLPDLLRWPLPWWRVHHIWEWCKLYHHQCHYQHPHHHQVWGMMQEDFEERTDPMAMVFPKVVVTLLVIYYYYSAHRWQSALSTSTVRQGRSSDTMDSAFFRFAPISCHLITWYEWWLAGEHHQREDLLFPLVLVCGSGNHLWCSAGAYLLHCHSFSLCAKTSNWRLEP